MHLLKKTGITPRVVEQHISKLKAEGILFREEADHGNCWVVKSEKNKAFSNPLVTNSSSPRGDKNSRHQAEFENSDLLDYPIFPQCQPKVDKK